MRNPIDRFILAELEELGLDHAPPADRVALIRRVTFDLTGLPPSPGRGRGVPGRSSGRTPTSAWSIACSPVRSTASAGGSTGSTWLITPTPTASSSTPNGPTPGAIATGSCARLNADLPYDRFLTLQLAGDDLQPGDRDALIATGFCRCGPREVVGGNVIPEVKRQNELSEITGTVGSVFLGLTIGCARCHDHKFDAIPTTDYYRLQAFFAASRAERRADRVARPSEIDSRPRRKQIDAEGGPAQEAARRRSRLRIARRSRRAKMTMLSAEERAVAEHARRRSGRRLRRSWRRGCETSLRITWEEVAAAVAANRGRHGPARAAEARDLRDRANASPPAGARDGARRPEVEGGRDVRPSPRRLQEPRPEGRPAAAGRDPGLAAGRRVPAAARISQGRQDRPAGGAGGMARRAPTIR